MEIEIARAQFVKNVEKRQKKFRTNNIPNFKHVIQGVNYVDRIQWSPKKMQRGEAIVKDEGESPDRVSKVSVIKPAAPKKPVFNSATNPKLKSILKTSPDSHQECTSDLPFKRPRGRPPKWAKDAEGKPIIGSPYSPP